MTPGIHIPHHLFDLNKLNIFLHPLPKKYQKLNSLGIPRKIHEKDLALFHSQCLMLNCNNYLLSRQHIHLSTLKTHLYNKIIPDNPISEVESSIKKSNTAIALPPYYF